jgi:hypothetical protein
MAILYIFWTENYTLCGAQEELTFVNNNLLQASMKNKQLTKNIHKSKVYNFIRYFIN